MRPPAYEYRHVVSFQETNALGNVYFVNYLKWQGECRELFLHEQVPSVLRELDEENSLVTTRCSCEYHSELTAFETVVVRMRLGEARQNRLTLLFEYWTERGGRDVLVARGEQELAWLRRAEAGYAPRPVPGELLDAVEAYRAALERQAAHA